ncbi:MAG: exopolyphosphatase [Gammaproteobacteria bacterium]|nr:exopolyphosphatase [Gammaproteobacteria bacterium]
MSETEPTTPAQTPAQTLAAVDLGSNSFHLVVAEERDGHISILDKIYEKVRLAGGLTNDLALDDAATKRALKCLSLFAERLANIPADSIKAVGTNTLRQLKNPEDFLEPADRTLGHDIEVISGVEEARLIYLGVAHAQPPIEGQQLVVDIGGGSSEFIIGQAYSTKLLASTYMGCVSYSKRFFSDGKLSEKNFKQAETAASIHLLPIMYSYRNLGWDLALGSSGTIKAVGKIMAAMEWTKGEITCKKLKKLRKEMIKAAHIDNVQLKGMDENRRPVLAGGVAILCAIFKGLNLQEMQVSSGALREGILYDLIGRQQQKDIRDISIDSFSARFNVNQEQAERVSVSAIKLYDAVKMAWAVQKKQCKQSLVWAAKIHEVGLTVAHSQYHKHGEYLVRFSDLPGFSQDNQEVLATLVRSHRRKLGKALFNNLPKELINATQKLTALLRLAVILNRTRHGDPMTDFEINAEKNTLQLTFAKNWLENNPLTSAELNDEIDRLSVIGITLAVE